LSRNELAVLLQILLQPLQRIAVFAKPPVAVQARPTNPKIGMKLSMKASTKASTKVPTGKKYQYQGCVGNIITTDAIF